MSLVAWQPVLGKLLKAIRYCAIETVAEVGSERDQPRFKRIAKAVDLHLRTLDEGCLHPTFVLVLPQRALEVPVLADLPERASREFMRSMRAHQSGAGGRNPVAAFFSSVPATVAEHSYRVLRDGVEIDHFEFKTLEVPPEQPKPARLLRVQAHVVGVRFGPARPQVVLRPTANGRDLHVDASDEQVELALAFREDTVTAMIVADGRKKRLIWLVQGDQRPSIGTSEQRMEYFRTRWARSLELLGQ